MKLIRIFVMFVFISTIVSLNSLVERDFIFSSKFNETLLQDKIFFDIKNNTLFIRKIEDENYFGTQLGKGLVVMINNEFSKIKFPSNKMRLVFDSNEFVEEFLQYLNFPFGRPPFVPLSIKWKYEFTANSNPYQIFSLLTTSSSNSKGESDYPAFFADVREIVLPKSGINLIKKRIKKTVKLVKSFQTICSKDVNALLYDIQRIENYLFNEKRIIYSESSEKISDFNEELPIFKDNFPLVELKSNDVLYVLSDEQTHLFTNKDEDSIFIVDLGSIPLSKGLSGVVKNHSKIKKINIFITHFHLDHVQSLASFIKHSSNKIITFYITKHQTNEFVGFILSNLPHLINPSKSEFLFDLKFVDDEGNGKLIDGVYVKPIHHNLFKNNSLKHFILSVTWTFREQEECLKVFSGDLNPPSPRPTDVQIGDQVANYFVQVFKELSGKCANAFFDYGHFEGVNLDNLLKTQINDLNSQKIYPNYVFEHKKDAHGYQIYKLRFEGNINDSPNIIYLDIKKNSFLKSKRN